MDIVYAMPIIAGNTAIYGNFNEDNSPYTVTVTSLASPSLGIKIQITGNSINSTSSEARLYTTMGGAILYSANPGTPGVGTVSLFTWLYDVTNMTKAPLRAI